ncbi:MAG: hypothetical protein HC933_13060 [Pleurocapsa sp. SU_196_0]|nr:hypothetical protein [Pleurocapsa sp. SU_196_0]
MRCDLVNRLHRAIPRDFDASAPRCEIHDGAEALVVHADAEHGGGDGGVLSVGFHLRQGIPAVRLQGTPEDRFDVLRQG